VTNAVDGYDDAAYRDASLQRDLEELRGFGLEVIELDLRTYFGRPQELRETLSGFDLIYVRGGNTFVLRRAFRQSGADEIVKEMLASDTVVYAGYSAGVCLLAPSLRGIEFSDDPEEVPEGYEPPIVWDGLGVLPYHVLPHFESEYPGLDQINLSILNSWVEGHIPFIALRDGEAIVIDGQKTVVVG
jgi:dipeptidase E